MTRAALFLIAVAVSAAAHAQVNKCIDANGRVSYTQDPCPTDARSASIERDVPPAQPQAGVSQSAAGKAAKNSGPMTPAEEEQAFQKRQQELAKSEKEAAQKAAQAQQKQQACQEARERLATFQAGGRITRLGPNGERYFLSDDQIQQEAEAARQLVDRQCN